MNYRYFTICMILAIILLCGVIHISLSSKIVEIEERVEQYNEYTAKAIEQRNKRLIDSLSDIEKRID